MNKLLAALALVACIGMTPAQAKDQPGGIVLINAFTVPAEVLDEAIVMWVTARDFLRTQPGYKSTKLHQSISPDAKYLLINVAQWESAEAYRKATGLMRDRALLPKVEGVVPGPGLYTVIRE